MTIIDEITVTPIIEVEQLLLSAILHSPAAYDTATQGLTGMSDPRHAHIWDACKHLVDVESAQLEWKLVVRRLESTGALEQAGGREYVRELYSLNANTENAAAYTSDLAFHAAKRMLLEAMALGSTALRDEMPRERFEQVVATQMAALEGAARLSAGKNPFPQIAEVGDLDEALDFIEGDSAFGQTTGIPELDDAIGGLKPGQLVVVGAQSGTGKTAIVQKLAKHIAHEEHQPMLSFSPEMSRRDLNLRLLADLASVNSHKLMAKNSPVTEDDWIKLAAAAGDIRAIPWYVCDEPDITVERMVSLIATFKREHPALKVVTVDHVGLVDMVDKKDLRRDQVLGEISWRLRQVARRLDITVVLLTQLNDSASKREEKLPIVADVKESKKIVENADVIILMHRYDREDLESPQAGEMLLRIVKNRNGGHRDLVIFHQLHYLRLSGDPRYAEERARQRT